ncbi:MAG: hypothetical protein GY756_18200 [bacterium]|nr:hypothetical protein [bacterium]
MESKEIYEIYKFDCICCGDCCTGNMEININLYDLYKLSKHFNFDNTSELFNRDLVRLVQVQNNCWTPQIIFRQKPFTFCPWLINDMGEDDILRGFCSLHPHSKPLICKMAPAGRTVDFEKNLISYKLTSPTENCPGMKSHKENNLLDLTLKLKDELEYEYRFYRILEQIKDKSISKNLILKELYSFDLNLDFKKILSELEGELGF